MECAFVRFVLIGVYAISVYNTYTRSAGGTAGAVLTCPLEVVKTRLQSSHASALASQSLPRHFIYSSPTPIVATQFAACDNCTGCVSGCGKVNSTDAVLIRQKVNIGLISCLRNIVHVEGPSALFKGLVPNLVGVAPSRAIYFGAYAQAKVLLNTSGLPPDTPIVHLLAAAVAGFSSATCTNPIWLIKTRLQLNYNTRMSIFRCALDIYRQNGLRGFYKGVTASYYGLAETVIHLVTYEEIKLQLREMRVDIGEDSAPEIGYLQQFFEYMGARAVSKTIATCVAYPHEVARTRLREEGSQYRSFWQTLALVFREEGVRGLYRGLATQLVRQIPNTAIMMATYEAVVYVFQNYQQPNYN